MPHIFISYAKKDTRQLAQALAAALNALPETSAWMDHSLDADSSWANQIQTEIDRADYIIVLLSPDVNRAATPTQSRSFVLNEIDYAQQDNKPILPVMVYRTRVPVQIAGIQYIDLTSAPDDPTPIVERVQRRYGAQDEQQVPAPRARTPQQNPSAPETVYVPTFNAVVIPSLITIVIGAIVVLVLIINLNNSGTEPGDSTTPTAPLLVATSGTGIVRRTPTPTLGSASAALATDTGPQVTIAEVAMPGFILSEAVRLTNVGTTPVDLEGWTLTESQGNVFTFADQLLFPGGDLWVYTREGTDTPTNLYWNRFTAMLGDTGEVVTLRDDAGETVDMWP